MRVVTLNLWGLREPLDRRLETAALGLDALAPDVIFLQEVIARAGGHTAARLAGLLGAAWRAEFRAATGDEGLAILSRHPFDEPVLVRLPEPRNDERRILLSARVHLGGAAIWCHTTHLHWRMVDGVARERQVVAIDDAIRVHGGADVHVLAGDFNAAPDCDEIRFLCGRHTLEGRRTYWQDAFARARPGERGFTWARRNPNTAHLAFLERDRRIDYVFVSQEKKDGRGKVVDARVVLDQPGDDGVWPSDHFGVMAEIA